MEWNGLNWTGMEWNGMEQPEAQPFGTAENGCLDCSVNSKEP